MTRAEILNCLTDRPCDSCKFHESGRCERWECVFEEKPDDAEDCEDKRMTREEAIAKLKNFADHCQPNEEFLMAIEALSAEPCEDCISRQAAIDLFTATKLKQFDFILYARAEIKMLPSVTTKQKMGHWIDYQKNIWIYAQCSECGTVHDTKTNYCPNCGAKMVEPQESEDNE